MSDMIPYQADPYRQGSAGGQDYLSAQGYPFPDGTGLPGGQVGYYSADYLSGWSDPYLASPGSQGIPYSKEPAHYSRQRLTKGFL